jgi:predicted phosphodiesterase
MSENNVEGIAESNPILEISDNIGLKKLPSDVLEQILSRSIHLDPIIPRIFGHLLNQCIAKFDFISDPLPFNDYLNFYKETNRLIPTLPRKIITEDCYSKVFFIGDTHGAIQETFMLIEYFYQIHQQDSKVKFIFVGDYVDRNPFDLENLTLITAFRLLFPDNVILLRGNHEDRLINTHYGFINNLLRAFWEKGEILYDEISKFFIHLPIVHISQMHSSTGKTGRVMTVHGGIPINLLDFLNPLDLQDLEQQLICEVEESKDMDALTNTMLWADPDEMIQGVVTGEHLHGRIKFGLPVFDAFMKKNQLDLLVRGHQKWKEGFRTFFGGKLYSLFTTSTYDGVPKFHPKILQLEYGQPPKIIPVEKESLNIV